MAVRKINLKEGDRLYNMVKNYDHAMNHQTDTPETILEQEINQTLEKIRMLTGAIELIDNSVLKLVIKEKIVAYKDLSISLVKIGQKMNQFTNETENKIE